MNQPASDREIHWFTERLFWPHVKPKGDMIPGDMFRNIRSGMLYEIWAKYNENRWVQFVDHSNGRLHSVLVSSLQEHFERGNVVWV